MHPHSGVKGGKCLRTFEGHKVCRSSQFFSWSKLIESRTLCLACV
jgi:hypothetical protein